MKIGLILVIMLSFVVLFGCVGESKNVADNKDVNATINVEKNNNMNKNIENANEKTIEKVKIANPASEYCIQKGGKLRSEERDGGVVGICKLPIGIDCEEWAYYRGKCPDENQTKKLAKCPPIHIPEPDWTDMVNGYALRNGYNYDYAPDFYEKEYPSVHMDVCKTADYKIVDDKNGCKVCVRR